MNKVKSFFEFLKSILFSSESELDHSGLELSLGALESEEASIKDSRFFSRDLSWLTFNQRVLVQAEKKELTVFERLKFMAITASNLDEFFMVRVGSLYNYLDYNKKRIDYSGLRERPFRARLLGATNQFFVERNRVFKEELSPLFEENGFQIVSFDGLSKNDQKKAEAFFDHSIFPMLTPMAFNASHNFPILLGKNLILAVVTISRNLGKVSRKLSFVQIPSNVPKFYNTISEGKVFFLPSDKLIEHQVQKLFRNIEIESVDTFRVLRNGDFTLEESDDIEADFVEEIKQKIEERKEGRVVSMEIGPNPSSWMLSILKKEFDINEANIFTNDQLLDYTRLWALIGHEKFRETGREELQIVRPFDFEKTAIFESLKKKDVLLHHPYNSFEPVLQLIEKSAVDPDVMAIKLTIYRLAKNSRVTAALLKAAQNGKHVSALFEIKARFDEENNIREAEKLQKAGCFVMYGIGGLKTHTKLLLIVRKEAKKVVRYAHMATGNYNEDTARLYTDLGILSTNENYTKDISEFFNVITGHSVPDSYKNLITSPHYMRKSLIKLIQKEAKSAIAGKPAGICIKVNSLEDKEVIEELYLASQAGVKIKLIVRGICCLKPGILGLSENITVKSIVGHYLEHTRVFYFHNKGVPKVFGGSADVMVRSFDRRIEAMFEVLDGFVKKQMILMLSYNLKDTVNSFQLEGSGRYKVVEDNGNHFNVHKAFYSVNKKEVKAASLDYVFVKKYSQ